MSRLGDMLRSRLRTLFRRERVEAEMDAELRFHLDHLIAEKCAAGMNARAARTAALRELGAGDWIEEACRDARGLRWLESLAQDVRFALRQMRHHPGFTATVVLILALGIGANTAIFSAVNAVLLRPLPYPHPQELMQLYMDPGHGSWPMDYPDFVDWRAANHTFSGMALRMRYQHNLRTARGAVLVRAMAVSQGFFKVLGVAPMLGRGFLPGEAEPGRGQEVVLSYALWQQYFGGSASVIGQTVHIDGQDWAVVGVMPQGFDYPANNQLWTPMTMTASAQQGRGNHNYFAVGRLKPGVTLAQARADLNMIAARLAKRYPKTDRRFRAMVVPMRQDLTGGSREPLLLTLGAAALLWLIACVDVASMLLARAIARQPEMAIRTALGGGRLRLAQQVLVETVLLALAGGVAGAAVGYGGVRWLTTLKHAGLAAPNPIQLDLPVLAFAFGLAAVTGLAFGLVLVWRGPTAGAGARVTISRRRTRLNRGLVIAEVALSVVLLVAAGLLLTSFYHLLHTVGADTNGILTAHVVMPEPDFDYGFDPHGFRLIQSFLHRVEALPGVQQVALTDALPPGNSGYGGAGPVDQPRRGFTVQGRSVSPGYFHLFGIPLLRGRGFTASDLAQLIRLSNEFPGPPPPPERLANVILPAIVNQTLAREFWPGQNPIGKRLWEGQPPPGPSLRVVGVVADVKNQGLASPVRPALYTPFGQIAWFYIAVRAAHPMALVPAVRKALAATDPNLALSEVATMQQVIDDNAGGTQFLSMLLALFAGLALILAFAGIYGVLSYTVAQRRQEMGIRLSLGAQPRQVQRQVLGGGMRMAVWGMVAGIAGALAAGRLLTSSLYQVSAYDPAILAAAALIIAIAAACACYGPARRAARVDPAEVLREG